MCNVIIFCSWVKISGNVAGNTLVAPLSDIYLTLINDVCNGRVGKNQ